MMFDPNLPQDPGFKHMVKYALSQLRRDKGITNPYRTVIRNSTTGHYSCSLEYPAKGTFGALVTRQKVSAIRLS